MKFADIEWAEILPFLGTLRDSFRAIGPARSRSTSHVPFEDEENKDSGTVTPKPPRLAATRSHNHGRLRGKKNSQSKGSRRASILNLPGGLTLGKKASAPIGLHDNKKVKFNKSHDEKDVIQDH